MKIALVHDHFAQDGGAERVFWMLAEMYPQADIFTILYNRNYIAEHLPGRQPQATFIQNLPLGVSKYQWHLPLMPMAIESLNFEKYDLIISSASSFAKGIISRPGAIHICYCHTPTRYLWHYSSQYLQELRLPKFFKKIVGWEVSRIRSWDRGAAERVDYFIANSKTTQERIKKYYQRDSLIIYPPVDTAKFFISDKNGDYFLAGGRFIPHKRFDLAIRAFNKLNLPLKIFGDGPDFPRLRKMARPNIEFLGKISDARKAELMSGCLAFIHPQEEDFGISAVEAQASGRPVIAFNRGGASETVRENISGLFFYEQTWEELADTVLRFLYQKNNFNPQIIKQSVEKFNVSRFKWEVQSYINKVIMKYKE